METSIRIVAQRHSARRRQSSEESGLLESAVIGSWRFKRTFMIYKRRFYCCLIATIVCGANLPRAAGAAADRVRLARTSEAGEVTKMTKYEVTVDKGATGSVPLAVNEI